MTRYIPTYKYIAERINSNRIKYYFTVTNDDNNCRGFDKLRYETFIQLLQDKDKDFFKVFQASLNDATSQLSAYFWECCPVSEKTVSKNFEFVVTKSTQLDSISQNYSSFQEHIDRNLTKPVCSFPSWTVGDTLVIPLPETDRDYKNISNFTKNAADQKQQELWQAVGNELQKKVNKGNPVWLSTHGLGVYFLHVRVCDNPGHYSFGEYKTIPNPAPVPPTPSPTPPTPEPTPQPVPPQPTPPQQDYQKQAITQIKNLLNEQPVITNSDLDTENRNWESEIKSKKEATEITAILERLNKDIQSKRKEKLSGQEIENLIKQAESKTVYAELKQIIDELARFYTTDVYKKNEAKIKALDKKLSGLNKSQFSEDKKKEIEDILTANDIKESDLPDTLKAEINKLKTDPNLPPEKINETVNKAKDFSYHKEAETQLKPLLQKTKTVNNEKDKKALANELLRFKNGTRYQREVYEENKPEIERFLLSVSGNNNQDSGKPKNDKFTLPAKIAVGCVGVGAIVLLAVLVFRSSVKSKSGRRR